MGLLKRIATPFGLAVTGLLILAGWALWSGGILDGPIARQVRSSSVYAAPGTGLDKAAAERVIGNRRLVVILLTPGADLRDACHSVKRAADGTLVLVLSRTSDGYDDYGCATLPGVEDENLGKAVVAESIIGAGIDSFPDRPLDAVKVVAVNYDLLVRSGAVPDGARTISPSLPRYLIAAAAIAAVLLGAIMLYVGGRRAARLTADRTARAVEAGDARTQEGAAAAVLAQQIVDLDARFGDAPQYRRLASDYADALLAGDTARMASLSARCRKLAAGRG